MNASKTAAVFRRGGLAGLKPAYLPSRRRICYDQCRLGRGRMSRGGSTLAWHRRGQHVDGSFLQR